MKYFVSADIHGFYDEWITALNEKGFNINNPEHKIILCGDMFDRGRQPKQIIDFILSHKDKFILIRGNHEDLMEEMIQRNNATFMDLSNGTSYTIVDLYPEWQISEFDLPLIAQKTGLKEVLDMCVDYFETEHYIFVHGWIPIVENCYYYDADLGLYYLNSRYYDSAICRFISPDSIEYLGANGDLTSFNLYAYCSNNPVMYIDPSKKAAAIYRGNLIR